MLESTEVASPSTARINEGSRSAAPRNVLGVYPKTRTTPVDMGVEIDQPWTHDAARNILNLLGLNRTVAVQNRRDLAVCESDIFLCIQAHTGVHHPSPFEEEIYFACHSFSRLKLTFKFHGNHCTAIALHHFSNHS